MVVARPRHRVYTESTKYLSSINSFILITIYVNEMNRMKTWQQTEIQFKIKNTLSVKGVDSSHVLQSSNLR